jgi:hypothetical protein
LTQGKHTQALTLARPVQQRVELRTECLTDRGRDGREFLRELGDGVTETVAHAYARKQGLHTLGGAVKAIDENPFNPVRRLMVERRTLKLLIRLGKSRRTGGLGVA